MSVQLEDRSLSTLSQDHLSVPRASNNAYAARVPFVCSSIRTCDTKKYIQTADKKVIKCDAEIIFVIYCLQSGPILNTVYHELRKYLIHLKCYTLGRKICGKGLLVSVFQYNAEKAYFLNYKVKWIFLWATERLHWLNHIHPSPNTSGEQRINWYEPSWYNNLH